MKEKEWIWRCKINDSCRYAAYLLPPTLSWVNANLCSIKNVILTQQGWDSTLRCMMLLSNFQCSLAAFLPDIFFSATLGCEVTPAGPGCSFKDRSSFTKTCDIRLLPTSTANTVVQRKESSFIFSPVHRPWHAITLPQLHTTQPVHVCVCASASHFSTLWESLSRDLEF